MSPGVTRAVVAGAGPVGRWVRDVLAADGVDTVLADREPGADLTGDVTDPPPRLCAELARADVVVLALPVAAVRAAAPALAGCLRPDALVVETCSTKSAVAAVMAGLGREALGVNPMFRPTLAAAGRPVLVCPYRHGPRTEAFRAALGTCGVRLVDVAADRHDRLASASQVLVHAAVLAFGEALRELGEPVDDVLAIAPPPAAVLLGLLARVLAGSPEVYADVQCANAEAPEARRLLAAAVARLDDAAGPGGASGEAGVRSLLTGIREHIGPQLDALDAHAARVLDIPPPAPVATHDAPRGGAR